VHVDGMVDDESESVGDGVGVGGKAATASAGSSIITAGRVKASCEGQCRTSPMAMEEADASGTTPEAVRQATVRVSTR